VSDQAREALTKANAVRSARRVTRERIESGELSLLEALQDIPPELAKVKVERFLRWGPYVGPTRARAIGGELNGLSLADLTWSQRRTLAARLPERLT
jgi:hypothetical protein